MKLIGLIINPIAGMGGSVGLKGTDGVLEEALARGAIPLAAEKAGRALQALLPYQNEVVILTSKGPMGTDALDQFDLTCRAVHEPAGSLCNAEDTVQAAQAVRDAGADVIAFAGGDGTARNIYEALGERIPVIGIPAGVKIHSPVYAKTPEKAGELLKQFMKSQAVRTKEAEVLDINEEDYRDGLLTTRLFGYLQVPFERRLMQGGKAPTPMSEKGSQLSIAASIAKDMVDDAYYIIGPGSTTRTLMEFLGVENTLLGVDVLLNKKNIAADVSEKELLLLIGKKPAKLIITPTGGQGYLLGRGNQQISPAVLKKLGKKNIIAAATNEKLAGLRGQPLLVDTGSLETDEMLRGYIRVVTGDLEVVIYSVE